MASTAEKMDATSTSLTSKDSESATEALSAMEIASPLQVQNVDMCQDLDGNSGDATQLTSSGNCNPATDEIAYSKHSRCSVPHEDCQTSELITDVKLQRNAEEHSRRMEIGSEENADSCAVFGESESCSVQKEENKKHPAICQSLDDEKTTEATQEMEESPSLTQPYEDALADGKEHLLLVGDVASSETTPTGEKCEHSLKQITGDVDDEENKEDENLQVESSDPLMGFTFNEFGQLRDEDGKPFEFAVYDIHQKNQRRYERLGEAITEEVYKLLESKCGLQKIILPLMLSESTVQGDETDDVENHAHSFVFASKNWMTTEDRLLVLIHGSGVVRAGQWARRLIINEDLEKGSQIPYIERAMKEGYEILVLNTNLNKWPDGSQHRSEATLIPENESPEMHASYVWHNLIVQCAKAKHIALVAHSYGGVVVTHLVTEETDDFLQRVFAVALTDSVHSLLFADNDQVKEFFTERVRNWVTSDADLDVPLPCRSDYADAPQVSAGHRKHEWTSFSSFESVFEFFHEQYQKQIAFTGEAVDEFKE